MAAYGSFSFRVVPGLRREAHKQTIIKGHKGIVWMWLGLGNWTDENVNIFAICNNFTQFYALGNNFHTI